MSKDNLAQTTAGGQALAWATVLVPLLVEILKHLK
jgi:hypothetical protein